MPHSDPATAEPTRRAISLMLDQTTERPFTVLDCGVGAGIIGRTVRVGFKTPIEVTGLEIYAPYLKAGPIRERMEQTVGRFHHFYAGPIIHTDFVPWLDGAADHSFHAVIFGDSLEHVTPVQALKTLARARRVAKLGVIVNAPVVHYPQGAIMGNPHEAHQLHWSQQEWERLGGVYMGGNGTVGCFWFHPRP